MKKINGMFLEKSRKLFATFMDLEKAYDNINRQGLWNVLKIHAMGGQGSDLGATM